MYVCSIIFPLYVKDGHHLEGGVHLKVSFWLNLSQFSQHAEKSENFDERS